MTIIYHIILNKYLALILSIDFREYLRKNWTIYPLDFHEFHQNRQTLPGVIVKH